jgi:hypothetical protein
LSRSKDPAGHEKENILTDLQVRVGYYKSYICLARFAGMKRMTAFGLVFYAICNG